MKEAMNYVKDKISGSWWYFKDTQQNLQAQTPKLNRTSNYVEEKTYDETVGHIEEGLVIKKVQLKMNH